MNYFFLTCNNPIRKEHMLKEFSDYNLIEINPVVNDISRYQSGTTGFIRIIENAIKIQDKQKPFQPFVIFEDDVKKYRTFPDILNIPDDTDILYIGLSKWGIVDGRGQHDSAVFFDNIDDNIIRIYNMLSTHGMIICSLQGLLAVQKCVMETYFINTGWDICLAQIQPYYKIYALKIPLVYQFGLIGGNESSTAIEFANLNDNTLDKKQINTTLLSVITLLNNN